MLLYDQNTNYLNKEIIKRLPNWINTVGQYCLCLSNDIDSLMSCYYLTLHKKWDIKYFYDFYGLYKNHGIEVIPNTCIAIDADLYSGKCFGNHLTNNINKDAININSLCNIGRQNYYDKFAGSTLITILSILDIPIDNFTIEQQEVLLCIDTMFKSYYFNKKQATYYIDTILGYKELINILEKHDVDYFYKIIDKYNLYASIDMVDGYLRTDIKLNELNKLFGFNLELPSKEFLLCKKFIKKTGIPAEDNIFSLAWTYKNSAIYSVLS